MSKDRAVKLAATAQKELADIFAKKTIKELKDPRFQGLISIVDVVVKDGYQCFNVFLSMYEDEYKEGVLAVLKEAKSKIRGELCRRMRLRVAPEITFEMDESIKRGTRILELLNNIVKPAED